MNRAELAGLLALSLVACASTQGGKFTWADTLPDRESSEILIRPGDLIRVNVAQQDQWTVTTRVRPDGSIPLALVPDVEIAGAPPGVAAARIQGALEGFVVDPQVTVAVEERAPVRVAVLGSVARPGMYDVDCSQGVLHALAYAGGLTELADSSAIYVLRRDGRVTIRLRFTLALLNRGEGVGQRFAFQPGDVLMVEEQ